MKRAITVFFTIGILGSLSILLALSVYFQNALPNSRKDQQASLMSVFKWILRLSIGERFSVFAIIFLLLFLLIIDSIFVFWFLCKLKLRRDKVSLPNSYKKMRPIDDIETPTVLNDSTSQSMPNIYFSQEKTLKDSLEQSLAEVKKNAKEVKHCKSLHSIVGSRYFATKTLKCDDKSYEFIIYNGAEVAL